MLRPPSPTLFCAISSIHGGPSENGVSGLFIVKLSKTSAVIFVESYSSKKLFRLTASPKLLKAYLVVSSPLNYGKFKKFPVSSSDFNCVCFGKTSEPL